MGGPRRISRQVSAILGVKRLPKVSPRGSKMGSKIESELKMSKSQKTQYLPHESLNFKDPGSPKSDKNGATVVPNRIFDAEAFGKPLESLLEHSWRPQEPK